MSAPEETFSVGFKQLSPDARMAGADFGETERANVPAKELRGLLRAADALAPTVAYPLVPELRIKAPTGRYVVQLKEGRLHFISWSSAKSRGGNPTPDQILAIIAGEEVEDDTTPTPAPEVSTSGASVGRWVLGTLLALVTIGSLAFSLTSYTKPPGNLLPEFSLMEPAPAARLMEQVAGNYETGTTPGDRRLQIGADGRVVWVKFGQDRSEVERREFTAQAATTAGQPALFTSRKSLIKVKDPTTLLLFGDAYLRVKK
jgi:hypothetical protein